MEDRARREDVSLNDNFFDLGGNSLTMMDSSSLWVAHGLDVTVSDLFRFGTLAGCARHFEQGAPTAPSTVSAERRRQGRQLQAARRRAAGGGNA